MSLPIQAKEATFGRYTLLRPLGEGGMGMLYVAYDPVLDRKVALKFVHANHVRNTEADLMFEARFAREARALARISHPNIVGIFDFGMHDGRAYMAMELVEGCTLKQWLHQPGIKRAWHTIVEVFIAVGEGLAAAHAVGLIHRDVKPDNVLMGDDGRARVVDFGIAGERSLLSVAMAPASASASASASWAGASGSSSEFSREGLTKIGHAIGTPLYMSPEQSRGDVVEANSDVFSYCLMLYEALYGVLPHVGTRHTSYAQACNYDDAILKIRTRPTKHPDWLEQLLHRGLTPDPAQRIATMDELVGQLRWHYASKQNRWQRYGVALSLLAGLGLAVVVTDAALVAPADGACYAAQDKWDEVWGESQNVALVEKIAERGILPNHPVWKEVQTKLSVYREAWILLQENLCTTLAKDRPVSTNTEAQLACLERSFVHVKAIVGTWLHDPKFTPFVALQQLKKLPEVQVCEDVEQLQNHTPLPQDPELRREVLALREELVKVDAKDIWTDEVARAEFEGIRERAAQVGDLALLADIEFISGNYHQARGEYKSALADLDASFLKAVATRYYFGAVSAIIDSTLLQIYLMNNPDVGDERSNRTDSVIRAAGDPIHLVAHAGVNRAISFALTDRKEQAIRELWRVLELCDKAHYLPMTALIFDTLAITYRSLNRFEEAYVSGQRALRLALYSLSRGDKLRANFQANLGQYLCDLGHFDQALHNLNEADERYRHDLLMPVPDWIWSIRVEALVHLGRYGEAMAAVGEIRRLQQSTGQRGHPIVEWADLYEAKILLDLGLFERAFLAVEEGVRKTLADPTIDPASQAFALRLRSQIEMQRQHLPAARRDLAQAWSLLRAHDGRSRLEQANVLQAQASLYLALGDLHAARRAIDSAYGIALHDYGATNTKLIPFELVRAEVFAQLGDREAAQQSLFQSHRLLEEMVEPERLPWLAYWDKSARLRAKLGDTSDNTLVEQHRAVLDRSRDAAIQAVDAQVRARTLTPGVEAISSKH